MLSLSQEHQGSQRSSRSSGSGISSERKPTQKLTTSSGHKLWREEKIGIMEDGKIGKAETLETRENRSRKSKIPDTICHGDLPRVFILNAQMV